MRSIYAKYLKGVVSARLKGVAPPFLPVRVESKLLLKQHSTVFAHPCDVAVVYVILLSHPKNYQAFTFEYGWSTTGAFPAVLPVKCPGVSAGRTEFSRSEMHQRVSAFISRPFWWWLEDPANMLAQFQPSHSSEAEVRLAVDRSVEESFQWLEDNLFPYLREYVEYIGRRQP